MSGKKSFIDLINTSQVPVLVDFYADWCGPCQTLSPIVREVAAEFHGKVKIIKINVDRNPAASLRYGIRSIPTLILFSRGRILWRQAGVMTRRDLRSRLDRVLQTA